MSASVLGLLLTVLTSNVLPFWHLLFFSLKLVKLAEEDRLLLCVCSALFCSMSSVW